MKYLSLFFILLFIACGTSRTSHELTRWQSQAETIEIIRDDFGVPHIYGKTDADAVFGLMYAQCEDDFPRVERNFARAIGRLAESEGKDFLYSDLRARMYMTREEAENYYDSAPTRLKDLCVAWGDGINYYLHTHPEVVPKVIQKFEPWMMMYFTEGSIGGDIERISTEKIKAFYEGQKELQTEASSRFPAEPKGSNGFAISGDLTESGNTMLWINPHTSFYFRGEFHVVSEEGLNAYGAVTWGQFFIYQGFNENIGWMHTSTYTDVIDEFKERIIYKDGVYSYQYGEEERPIRTQEVTLKYDEEGQQKEQTFTIYRTHHGPITHVKDDYWIATKIMWKPVKALEQSFSRTKKKNHAEFREVMNIRANSSNNTVFADSEGNIAYYHGNYIPIRDTQFDYSEPVDGSNPNVDYRGLHTVEETITVTNPPNGWIQNCNSTPFTCAGANSPKEADYPYYMATAPENFRGVHAIPLLEQLEETKDLTIDKLIAIGYDPYLPAFEEVIPALITAFEKEKKPELEAPIKVLNNWDMQTGKEAVGMTVAHFYGMQLYRDIEIPDGLRGMDRFNYFASIDAGTQLDVFSNAIGELESRFGTWEIPWGEVNRFQRNSGEIHAPFDDETPSTPVGLTTSRWGALAAYGMRSKQETKKIYGTRGNSFVAAVAFGEKLKAKTILAGGQSNNPHSPHFDDQIQRYADADFKEVAFYREDVEARAEEKYKPGQRRK